MSENTSRADDAGMPLSNGEQKGKKRVRSSFVSFLLELLIVIVLAVVVSTLLRQFVFQMYSIPSQSMENTLRVGDRILVNRIPVVGKQVERGDVIVFSDSQGWLSEADVPDNSFVRAAGEFIGVLPANGEQVVVKRVIGLGGDTVSCCTPDGEIEVNGTAISEPYLKEGVEPSSIEFSVTVPEGNYWVMGDNRSNSKDSRGHMSDGTEFVPNDDVIGKVQWVIWPLNHWSSVSHREAFADVPDAS